MSPLVSSGNTTHGVFYNLTTAVTIQQVRENSVSSCETNGTQVNEQNNDIQKC